MLRLNYVFVLQSVKTDLPKEPITFELVHAKKQAANAVTRWTAEDGGPCMP